jgi:hypothetical protein
LLPGEGGERAAGRGRLAVGVECGDSPVSFHWLFSMSQKSR